MCASSSTVRTGTKVLSVKHNVVIPTCVVRLRIRPARHPRDAGEQDFEPPMWWASGWKTARHRHHRRCDPGQQGGPSLADVYVKDVLADRSATPSSATFCRLPPKAKYPHCGAGGRQESSGHRHQGVGALLADLKMQSKIPLRHLNAGGDFVEGRPGNGEWGRWSAGGAHRRDERNCDECRT